MMIEKYILTVSRENVLLSWNRVSCALASDAEAK